MSTFICGGIYPLAIFSWALINNHYVINKNIPIACHELKIQGPGQNLPLFFIHYNTMKTGMAKVNPPCLSLVAQGSVAC